MFDRETTIAPIKSAIEKVRTILFNPVWIYAWLVIGVFVFMDSFALGPSGFSYALNEDARSLIWSWVPVAEADRIIAEFLLVQSGLRLVFALPSLFLVYLLSVLLLWIGSRAQVAFITLLSSDDWAAARAFHDSAPAGRSLFMFRLAFATLAFVALTFAILSTSIIIDDADGGDVAVVNFLYPVASIGAGAAFALNLLLRNLVAPVMCRFEINCVAALNLVIRLIIAHPIPFIVFASVKIAWTAVVWAAWIMAGCMTCFIGLLPVVHHALCAPLYAFDRLYSMHLIDVLLEDEGFLLRLDEDFE